MSTALTVTRETEAVVRIAHELADVTVYEHTSADGARYLVIDIDNESADDEAQPVAVYFNDAPILAPPHRRSGDRVDLWGTRTTSSGVFAAAKASGDVLGGVKRTD